MEKRDEMQKLNRALKCGFTDDEVHKVAGSRLGWDTSPVRRMIEIKCHIKMIHAAYRPEKQ